MTSLTLRAREAEAGDPARLYPLFYASVHRSARRHYRPAQLAAWAPPRCDRAAWLQRLKHTRLWVVEAAGVVRGFAELDADGRVAMCYVDPGWQRRGIGRLLLEELERQARVQGLTELRAEVSLAALGLFERCGFQRRGMRLRRLRGRSFTQFVLLKPLARVVR